MANPMARVETAETEAASWHARLGAPSVTSDEIKDFFAWRAAKPANADAYRRVEQIWGQTAKLKPEGEIGGALDAAMTRRTSGERTGRRTLTSLAFVGAAIALAVGGSYWWQGRGLIRTEVGQQQVVQLADGSSVRLDTASRIRVRLSGDRRVVELEAGQAMFDVAHDPSRPFVVEAGDVSVTAVGTVFDVRRDDTGARVTLVSGAVDVGPTPGAKGVRMAAGNQADVRGSVARVRPVDVAVQTSWTDGRIVFVDTPLAAAVAELNRYLTAKITLDARQLSDVPVNGVFKTGDRDAFVAAVSGLFDLEASRAADGAVHLRPRQK